MRFAIFVRKSEETYDRVDQVPEQLRIRTLAVRALDADAMLLAWELVDERDLETVIERLLVDPRAAYLHVHFAARSGRREVRPGGRGQIACGRTI